MPISGWNMTSLGSKRRRPCRAGNIRTSQRAAGRASRTGDRGSTRRRTRAESDMRGIGPGLSCRFRKGGRLKQGSFRPALTTTGSTTPSIGKCWRGLAAGKSEPGSTGTGILRRDSSSRPSDARCMWLPISTKPGRESGLQRWTTGLHTTRWYCWAALMAMATFSWWMSTLSGCGYRNGTWRRSGRTRRVSGASAGPNRSESMTATGRAPMARMSRTMPPTPVAAPWNGST